MLILVKLLTKYVIIISALGSVHEKFGVWIKAVPKSLQRRIPGRTRRKERLSRSQLKQVFLTDSDAELFMYLVQCIRFGSWKGRRLSRAYTVKWKEPIWPQKRGRNWWVQNGTVFGANSTPLRWGCFRTKIWGWIDPCIGAKLDHVKGQYGKH